MEAFRGLDSRSVKDKTEKDDVGGKELFGKPFMNLKATGIHNARQKEIHYGWQKRILEAGGLHEKKRVKFRQRKR